MKKFIPVRVDITNIHNYVQTQLGFLPMSTDLIVQCVIDNALKGPRPILHYLYSLCGNAYITQQDHIEQTVLVLCKEVMRLVLGVIPQVVIDSVEVIMITGVCISGERLDSNVYIELNDQSSQYFAPQFHAIAVDEFAVRFVSGQHCYAV